ncbi:MAG: glycosyltransferase, partial [Phaeodactylibacter sp.]|nr:glycosyltransferase [Phaeodactylibacter sp.]
MKILFVSFSILPNRGAAAHVTESLANNFTKEEMAVVGEQLMFEGRIKRSGNIPNYYYLRSNISYRGKGKRFFLALRWMLFPIVLWRMNRILKKENCDYVLGTFPDNYYLYAAYLVAKRNKVGFSSYFHNTYLENRPAGTIHHRFAKRVQDQVFDYSDYIFVMSEGMQGYYEERYPGIRKFVPLIHTFEEYPERTKPVDFDTQKEKYDLVLMGNFNESNVEATSRLVDALKGNPRVNIKMFTHVEKPLLRMRGIDADAIDYRGYVAEEDFYKELMDNDICVLTHGFTGGYSEAEYKTIFPTRTIPFLISGLPILAHSPSHAFLTRFLKKYDCAEVVDEASGDAVAERVE